jgi:hypothetical protein
VHSRDDYRKSEHRSYYRYANEDVFPQRSKGLVSDRERARRRLPRTTSSTTLCALLYSPPVALRHSGGDIGRPQPSTGECLCRIPYANFHEKALFVKADLAASVWPSLTGPALRAMLPSALSVSQLSSDSVHYGIRLFGLPRRRCNLRNGLSYS